MVSAKSKRGLIKALYNATRASKGNRCLITSQFLLRLEMSQIKKKLTQETGGIRLAVRMKTCVTNATLETYTEP